MVGGKSVVFTYYGGEPIFKMGPYCGERACDVVVEDPGYFRELLALRLQPEDRDSVLQVMERSGLDSAVDDGFDGAVVAGSDGKFRAVVNSRPRDDVEVPVASVHDVLGAIFGGSK
jgi:hypothetical protein